MATLKCVLKAGRVFAEIVVCGDVRITVIVHVAVQNQ